jgi:hypothetical protein
VSQLAYDQFLALNVGEFFAAADEKDWGTMPDCFVKNGPNKFRRSYDNVEWRADVDILGKTYEYEGKTRVMSEGWSGIKILDTIPEHLGYITEEEAQQRREADHQRLVDYVAEYGEYPDQGFW